MLLRGQLAELMVKIDLKLYRPYITKNGRTQMGLNLIHTIPELQTRWLTGRR
jgi:hypothetical protein